MKPVSLFASHDHTFAKFLGFSRDDMVKIKLLRQNWCLHDDRWLKLIYLNFREGPHLLKLGKTTLLRKKRNFFFLNEWEVIPSAVNYGVNDRSLLTPSTVIWKFPSQKKIHHYHFCNKHTKRWDKKWVGEYEHSEMHLERWTCLRVLPRRMLYNFTETSFRVAFIKTAMNYTVKLSINPRLIITFWIFLSLIR